MSADTDRLIAPVLAWARGGTGATWLLDRDVGEALADVLDAAEALHRGQRAAKMDALVRAEDAERRWGEALARAEAAKAQRDAVRAILDAYLDDRGPGAELVALGKINVALAGVAQPEAET